MVCLGIVFISCSKIKKHFLLLHFILYFKAFELVINAFLLVQT